MSICVWSSAVSAIDTTGVRLIKDLKKAIERKKIEASETKILNFL